MLDESYNGGVKKLLNIVIEFIIIFIPLPLKTLTSRTNVFTYRYLREHNSFAMHDFQSQECAINKVAERPKALISTH